MSDFIAILNVTNKVFHLVDWDRPVWFAPNDSSGLRIIPRPDHILVDPLLFFAHKDFGILEDSFEDCRHTKNLIDLNESKFKERLESSEKQIYTSQTPWIFLATFGPLDQSFKNEISQLGITVITSEIDLNFSNKLEIG